MRSRIVFSILACALTAVLDVGHSNHARRRDSVRVEGLTLFTPKSIALIPRWKMIILPILTSSLIRFILRARGVADDFLSISHCFPLRITLQFLNIEEKAYFLAMCEFMKISG